MKDEKQSIYCKTPPMPIKTLEQWIESVPVGVEIKKLQNGFLFCKAINSFYGYGCQNLDFVLDKTYKPVEEK